MKIKPTENVVIEMKSTPTLMRSMTDAIILQPNQIPVLNTESEGEIKIKSVEGMRRPFSKLFIYIILSIMSVGILFLFSRWFIHFRKWLLYISCDFDEAEYFFIILTDGREYIECKNIRQGEHGQQLVTFDNNLLRYIYEPVEKKIKCLEHYNFDGMKLKYSNITHNKGLNKQNAEKRRNLYGKNALDIPLPNLFVFLGEIMITPFFIVQYVALVLWILEGLAVYSITLFVFSILFAVINFIFVRVAANKINEQSEVKIKVKVFRGSYIPSFLLSHSNHEDNAKPDSENEADISLNNNKNNNLRLVPVDMKQSENFANYEVIECSELVPGDIFAIEEINSKIPCDCLLVSGSVLMNESMLNGEPTPIKKFPPTDPEKIFDFNSGKAHVLYDGTKLLQLKEGEHNFVFGIVLKTGSTSLKGQLVRSVIFPSENKDFFTKQILKFLLLFSSLMIAIFILNCVFTTNNNMNFKFYIFAFFDGFTQIVPPILTIYISLSKSMAMLRLKGKSVLGIQPEKLINAGQVTVCCFDKTGTLTKNDIDIKGHYLSLLGLEGLEYKLFASCHGVTNLNGILVGDNLDVQMFNYSKWEFLNSDNPEVKFSVTNGKDILNIFKVFEFSSEFLRMSVIVRDVKHKKTYVFVKGAPEVLIKLSNDETIPKDFNQQLYNFTMKGFRILCLGFKELPFEITDSEIESMTREHAETNLNFMGFLVSENKLKDDTAECLEKLKSADLELKIISGDNPLTTIQASREANIISHQDSVLLITIDNNKYIAAQIVESNSTEENLVKLDETSANLYENTQTKFIDLILEISQNKQIAITGNLYEFLKTVKTKNKVLKNSYKRLLHVIIEKCKVYSRMKPDQKSQVVRDQQSRGLSVAMVGDGANDCSALKQADVGISFSEADSSFCAPFSSTNISISCVEKVLLEGRGTLTNCVEIFHFIIASGAYNYFSQTLLVSRMTRITDFQSMYKNFLNVIPKIAMYAFSPPVDNITKHRPPGDMMTSVNIFSIFGQSIIGIVSMIVIWYNLLAQPFYSYTPGLESDGLYKTNTLESTTLIMTNCILLAFSNYAFLYTAPFKKQIHKNIPFLVLFIVSLTYNTALFFNRSIALPGLKYANLSDSFNLNIFLVTWGFGILMIIYELVIRCIFAK